MHWTFLTVVGVVLIFAAGAWYSKNYPGTIPVIT